jgi:predicted choloylglycine hydrolase
MTISTGFKTMRIETLKGSHYEIGLQIGKNMREHGWDLPNHVKERNVQFAVETERKVRSMISGLLEEIDGIADGGGYPRNAILTLALTLGRIPGCTALAVVSEQRESDKVIFARNYDGPPDCKEFTLYKTYPENGLSHIGCCWDLLWWGVGREDGVNEAGLAIAVNGVHGVYNDKPGVWDHIPVRAVLDNCEDTREAVSVLRKIPHLFAKNFLVADAEGDIAIVEAAQQNVAVLHPNDRFGVITNHFTSKNMSRYNSPKLKMFKTEERLRNAEAWLQESNELIDTEGVKRLLTDVTDGVCSDKTDFLTAWSWVTQCGKRSIELATGAPVKGDYKTYKF